MAIPAKRKREEVQRWDPFQELSMLQERMNTLFDEMVPMRPRLHLLPRLTRETWSPDIEVYDTEAEVVVKAHVPGIEKSDLDVEVAEDSITIRGEISQSEESKSGEYCRTEVTYGEFSRTMPLPCEVESDKARAHVENGVLEVRVPKSAEEKAKMKKVKIS